MEHSGSRGSEFIDDSADAFIFDDDVMAALGHGQEVMDARAETIQSLELMYGGRIFRYGPYSGTVSELRECPAFVDVVEVGVEAAMTWLEANDGKEIEETNSTNDADEEESVQAPSIAATEPGKEVSQPVKEEAKPPLDSQVVAKASQAAAGAETLVPEKPAKQVDTTPITATTSVKIASRVKPEPVQKAETPKIKDVVPGAANLIEASTAEITTAVGISTQDSTSEIKPATAAIPKVVESIVSSSEVAVDTEIEERDEPTDTFIVQQTESIAGVDIEQLKPEVEEETTEYQSVEPTLVLSQPIEQNDVPVKDESLEGYNDLIESPDFGVTLDGIEVIEEDSEQLSYPISIIDLDETSKPEQAGEQAFEGMDIDTEPSIHDSVGSEYLEQDEGILEEATGSEIQEIKPDSLVTALEVEMTSESEDEPVAAETQIPLDSMEVEVVPLVEAIEQVIEFAGETPENVIEPSEAEMTLRVERVYTKIENLEKAKTAEDCHEALLELRLELELLLALLGYDNPAMVAERMMQQDIASLKAYMALLVRSLHEPKTIDPNGIHTNEDAGKVTRKFGIHAVQAAVQFISRTFETQAA